MYSKEKSIYSSFKWDDEIFTHFVSTNLKISIFLCPKVNSLFINLIEFVVF